MSTYAYMWHRENLVPEISDRMKATKEEGYVKRAWDEIKGWFTFFCLRCIATGSAYEMIWTHVAMQE